MPNLRYHISLAALTIALIVLAVLCLLIGSVDISAGAVWDIICGRGAENKAWEIIVLQSRVPTIITAALAGAALAVSGLLLQTTFNNPLAGPSILGVSSGAGLGVAVVMLVAVVVVVVIRIRKKRKAAKEEEDIDDEIS